MITALTRLLSQIKSLIFSQIRTAKKLYRRLLNTKCRYKFHDRRKNSSTLIIILAGYKPFVWDDVLERVKLFAPSDADICIVSSGKYDARLAEVAEKNSWSYASTKRNCLTLALNIGILLHPEADFIYKIDEDIFVTGHMFDVLMKTYERAKSDGIYAPGIICPVNVYGHMRVLEKLGLLSEYEKRFGSTGYRDFNKLEIWRNPETAKFFWGDGNIVPHIDDMAEKFYAGEFAYRACPIRFSVGCILFRRELWQMLGMFRVPLMGNAMGGEEVQLCCMAMVNSMAVIVSDNTVVGHLSFGPQNEAMREYYFQNREKFRIL